MVAEFVPEKVARTKVVRETGWIYFVDRDGDIARNRLRGLRLSRIQKVRALGLELQDGFLYLIDSDGDVVRIPVAGGAQP